MPGDVVVGEVFHQLDDLVALLWREFQKRPQKPQALNRMARWRPELEAHFSREIEVFHLAPMTRKSAKGAALLKNLTPEDASWRALPAEATEPTRRGCNYANEQPSRQAKRR